MLGLAVKRGSLFDIASALEFVLAPKAAKGFLGFASLANSKLLKGDIHFQALGTNFRIWSDGIVSPQTPPPSTLQCAPPGPRPRPEAGAHGVFWLCMLGTL